MFFLSWPVFWLSTVLGLGITILLVSKFRELLPFKVQFFLVILLAAPASCAIYFALLALYLAIHVAAVVMGILLVATVFFGVAYYVGKHRGSV